MTITTNYTKEANPDTLYGGAMSSYRTLYWLKDILMNFMADPINIKDARLCKLLNMQNGSTPEQLNALFDIGVAYTENTQKACTTPKIFISLAGLQYPPGSINKTGSTPVAMCGARPMYVGKRMKVTNIVITVMTEKYDSTVVFTDFLSDFLLINEFELARDNGMISEFHVKEVTAPEFEQVGKSTHAKCIYTQKILIQTMGGISWTTDTQGPVFRGIKTNAKLT
jgi:hypothetical protein